MHSRTSEFLNRENITKELFKCLVRDQEWATDNIFSQNISKIFYLYEVVIKSEITTYTGAFS